MDTGKFWQQIQENLSLSFAIENVEDIESNCGSTWIFTADGNSYFITVEKCELETEFDNI